MRTGVETCEPPARLQAACGKEPAAASCRVAWLSLGPILAHGKGGLNREARRFLQVNSDGGS